MASKRQIKKNIAYVCGDAADACIISEAYMGVEPEKAIQLVVAFAELQDNSVRNVTTAFDHTPADYANNREYRKARKAYYRAAYGKLLDDFNKRVAELLKQLNDAIPAEAKKRNIEAN